MTYYTTKDFYLSGVLLLEGFRLVKRLREEGFSLFFFEKTEKLNQLIENFYRGKLRVDPLSYGATLRQLKGIMHTSVSTHNHGHNNNERQES